MSIPVVSSIRALDHEPRQFLWFTVFNVISWQCIVGPALILLARKIGMPASWVGVLISMLPFSMILVLFTVPLVHRFGSKRLMTVTWLARNLMVCSVFAMPWAMERFGERAGWYVLMAAVLGFCLIRALGSGGWFPWLHELVPPRQRADYFGAEIALTQLTTVGVVLMQAALLWGGSSLWRYLAIYAVGITSGMISLIWMSRVPGGLGTPGRFTMQDSLGLFRRALSDRPFLVFVIMASLCFSAATWYGAALILFMRDALGMSSNYILFYMALGSGGVLATIRAWSRYAEHSGSSSTMLLALVGHGGAALLCLPMSPERSWSVLLLLPVVIITGALGGALWMATHRAMLNYVREEGRVGYTSLWTVGTSMSLGLTPILVGLVIDNWGLAGFRVCFLVAGVGGVVCGVLSRFLVKDGQPLERGLAQLLNPELQLRTLARIAWISMGRHDSNRPTTEPAPQPAQAALDRGGHSRNVTPS